jgi:hypothetical protein
LANRRLLPDLRRVTGKVEASTYSCPDPPEGQRLSILSKINAASSIALSTKNCIVCGRVTRYG